MARRDGFKLAAQRHKCAAIVLVVDAVLLARGLDPRRCAESVVEVLGRWTDREWQLAAKVAGVNEPHETRALVVREYELRAERAA
jgi:hypothetical protein